LDLDTDIRNILGEKGVWITFQWGRDRDESERTGTSLTLGYMESGNIWD